MALRIEEDLDVPHAISGGAPQVRRRELEEVLFGAQDRHGRVVEAEEVLQVGEAVGGATSFRGRVRGR